MTKPVEFSKHEIANRQIDEAHLRELVSEFNKEGCLILDRVFDPAFIQGLNRAFVRDYQPYLVEKEHQDALCVGSKRYQITIEVKDEFNAEQLYANPLVLPLVEQLLGKRFVISDFTCVPSLPGAEDMHVHSDSYIFEGVPIAPLLPPHAVGLLIPLIRFNRLNGVTRLWPGTHRKWLANESLEDDPGYVDPELDVGSCMLMDYRLKHRGNANRSGEIRPLLYCNYSAPWYFDANNFKKQTHLKISDAEFEKLPERHKALFVRRNMKLA